MKTTKLGERMLNIKAMVEQDGLRLRQSVATAQVEDGREVAIDIDLGGPLLITIRPKEGGTWKTYVLSPQALVEAVLAVEDSP
jgi:hypothetical protein